MKSLLTAALATLLVLGCPTEPESPQQPTGAQDRARPKAVSTPTAQTQPAAAPPIKAQPVKAQPVEPKTEAHPPKTANGQVHISDSSADAALRARMQAALAAMGKDYVARTHHKNADGSPQFLNRLIFESSPYLIQHAHNPVHWRPWGDAAFAEAKRRDVPVLLSVGYATCHWCHVMEGESFEDIEIANYMNAHFVCVKMDREERPDVDNVYMSAVNMLHGRGGWPMTVVMTDERKPFFAGTYFPPRDGARGARKGFLTILRELSAQYKDDRETLLTKAGEISRRLAAQSSARPAPGVADHTALKDSAERFLSMHDSVRGGFGRRPKFPRPATLDFLLRYYRRSGDKRALDAVTLTLDKMNGGGIHDQVGGGFHRYTVDGAWLVPHFEKMLYDNGQLVVTYLDAYQITGDPEYARVVRRTLDYAIREMRDPGKAFWSATDADSEGHEGKFFVWGPAEIRSILGSELGDIAIRYWGVTQRGNFEGQNILNVPRPADAVARELGLTPQQLATKVEEAAQKLYAVRARRIPPLTDDKVLTAWNGLFISALARAAFVLNDERYAVVAAEAADAILRDLGQGDKLLRTWRAGSGAKYTGYLEDYAFFGQGLLDLYEATHNIKWLQKAKSLHEVALRDYEDKQNGGFFRTSHDAEKLLVRNKPDYDGAEPSGNSIVAKNLLRLSEFTTDPRYRTAAEMTLKWANRRITKGGTAVPAMLSALDFYLDKPKQVIVVSVASDPAPELYDVLRKHYLPNRMHVRVASDQVETLAGTVPYVSKKVPRAGKTTAYVCEGGVCKLPTFKAAVFKQQLADVYNYPAPTAPIGIPK